MHGEKECQHHLEDIKDVTQELMPMPTATDAQTPIQTTEPPTPHDIDIGGELPTIDEGDEHDADDLILESFYAELMSDEPLREEDDDAGVPGNMNPVPYGPVHMMPEATILFMTKSEQLDDEPLEPTEVYIDDAEPTMEVYETDEVGDYVEICYTREMAPTILDEDQAA